MLQENGVEPHHAVNIATLDRTLKLQVRHGLFIDAIGGTWAQLEAVRSHAQQRDIDDLEDKAKNSDFHGLYPAGRQQRKCRARWDSSTGRHDGTAIHCGARLSGDSSDDAAVYANVGVIVDSSNPTNPYTYLGER